MKKSTYLLLLSISLLSCSKNSNEEPKDEQLFDVSFNVSTFNKDIVDLKSAQALSGAVEQLAYFVFNENDQFLYYKEFLTSDESFEKINDKMPEGTYNIIFFGHNGKFYGDDGDDFFRGEDEKNPTLMPNDEDPFNDSFYKKITINVPDDNSNMSVSLDRVVGKLEVVFTDNIPSEVTKIEYSLTGTYWGLDLYYGSPFHQETRIGNTYISDDEKAKPNYKLEFYSFAGGEKGTINSSITIKCFDKDNNVIASRNITNIDIYRNKITRLSGEMFSSTKDNENSFSLTVDTDWSEVIERGFENGEDEDHTAPTINFTSPSTNASAPTVITAGQTINFTGHVSDNQKLKSITFTDLSQRTKSVNDFIEDFNSKLNNSIPSSGAVIDKSEFEVNFSIETITGAPAGEYTLTCTVIDQSDNQTTKSFYFKVK